MKLWSDSFEDGQAIPTKNAFGKHHPETHVALSDNLNPHLAWEDVPPGARSLALVVHDSEVPSRGDDVNQAGRTVPASLPRVDFYHWVLVDLPPAAGAVAEGALCRGVTARGKAGPDCPDGSRHGLNSYTGWFAADPDMAGDYFGYDGPCPPFNDELVHRYHFTLYALDVARCPVQGAFDGPAVLAAIAGHVLASASLSGTYHIYPDARGR
jgi:hypothetical protein